MLWGVSAPSGTVTFLFTDVEGSTRMWQADETTMRAALSRHDELLHKAIADHDGAVFSTMGDGLGAAFASASSAVEAALAAQRSLAAEPWPTATPLRVRMGIHTGEAEFRDGDYFGTSVNRAARLMGIGHGGQVVVSSVTAELLGDGVRLVDMGELRLRDLDRRMHVFQVGDGNFPPLRSLESFRGNLPVQLTSFVGRDEDLAAVVEELGLAKLVTLTGVGGVGKTRLALQVAAHALPGFGDGAWLCELAGADGAESMYGLVAATLGVVSRPGLDLRASVVQFLGPKRLLMVLDNCEHLVDSAADLAAAIVGACPEVRVLATSREALAVPGERIVHLQPLGLPDMSATVETMGAYDAVRLFVERARAARPGFGLTAGNAVAVGELCRRLDGIPLALELAAARVATMTPSEIVGHLNERFRLLAGRWRGAVERHQTLRATLDWSFSLLDPKERQVFDRLGIFAGGFDAEAAVAVAAAEGIEDWDVLDGLASLVAKSMVVVEAADGDSTRYRLLETMRHYARQRLAEEDDPDRWRARHAEHYAGLAEVIGPALNGPDELVWRPRLAAELDELRAAVDWSLDADGDHAVRIVAALAIQAAQQDTAGIGEWAERCSARAQTASAPLRTAVLAASGWNVWRRGDPAAVAVVIDALRDGLPVGCPATYLPHMILMAALSTAGRLDEARAAIEAGHAALDAIGAPVNGHVHLSGAAVSFSQGAAEAHQMAAAALAGARESRNPTALAIAWWALACSISADDPARANAALAESLALTRAGAGDGVYGISLCLAAALHARLGDRNAAMTLLKEGVRHGRDTGNGMTIASAVSFGVQAMADLSQPEAAAILAGALATNFEPFDNVIQLPERSLRRAKLDRVHEALGGSAFDAAFTRGAAMSPDEVVDYILDQIGLFEAGPAAPRADP
jgi:predicted ATPase/class 3 adenylate cyclase